MTRRKLPIGIQTFRKIREENCYYVDKTAYIQRLIDEGTHYFLSRPRRFGKSLFLDTLKELFEGNEPLFEGLHIHDRWDWSVRYPVVRLSFGRGNFKEPGYVQANVMTQLHTIAEDAGIAPRYDTAPECFGDLIRALHRQGEQRVVVLVDEYDKPILDALEVPEVARANRDFLRGLYATIKDSDAHIKFTFLTGVSKFSKVSLFSDLKTSLTSPSTRITPPSAATPNPTSTRYSPQNCRIWTAIKSASGTTAMLGGGEEKVYNPFDILLLFRNREFHAYWFETGTPTFLIETLISRGVDTLTLDNMLGSDELLSAFDVDHIATEALLFQTGYLTIIQTEPRGNRTYYRLSYPNQEVRQSLNESLLNHLTGNPTQQAEHSARLYDLLLVNDFAGLENLFKAFFASIPYQWHTNNDIANYEGYYASVFYSYFASVGLDIVVEDSSHGRLDMAVLFNNNVYLFEFKVVELSPEGTAMAQLRQKRYADKYRDRGEPIHLIAIEFSRETRNLVGFETARA